jgi:hypothetical protein
MIVLLDRSEGRDFAPNLWELSHLLHQWAEAERNQGVGVRRGVGCRVLGVGGQRRRRKRRVERAAGRQEWTGGKQC